MGQYDNDRTVSLIKSRMKGLGVDLEKYIGEIGKSWQETPSGFSFTCKDKAAYIALMTAVVQNLRFGTDNMVGGSQHQGVSFREVNQPDSLHIVLSTRPDPSDPVKATCSIHLDSVSVVLGRDSKTGQVNYDVGKVFQHLATDLSHTPLIVPGGEQGIVFGFRF